MEIKKFRNHYDLELITASHEGISLGDLVWDPLAGAPDFDHPGMPNTIYTAFLDAGLVTRDEFELFRKECRETPLAKAHLADTTIDIKTELISELKHPALGDLGGNFKLESVSKFTFGSLQVRAMDDLLRVKIDQYLERMKEHKWKEYDGRIRRVHMITELYYGSIKLVVEKKHAIMVQRSSGGKKKNRKLMTAWQNLSCLRPTLPVVWLVWMRMRPSSTTPSCISQL